MEIESETYSKMECPEALSGPIVGQFLKLLVQLLGARRVLEIGMFTGYATLSMAEGLAAGGVVMACEVNAENIAFASSFLDRFTPKGAIAILPGDAIETLRTLEPGFDLIFIDADKVHYPQYYEESVRLLRHGGCIVVDNAVDHGRVLQPETPGSFAIDQMNQRILEDSRVESVILTVRDGLQLVRKT
jgi:caffeoyl-CoA O-methyltransferase